MSKFDVIRAWKDARYRESLSAEEQAQLPEHPAGSLELDDAELDRAFGGEEFGFYSSCVPQCPQSVCPEQCFKSYGTICEITGPRIWEI